MLTYDPPVPTTRSHAANLFAEALWAWAEEIAAAYGFTLHWEDTPTTRTLMLLGPDSPSDMILTVKRYRFGGSYLEAVGAQIIQWMDERGQFWTGRDAGVVPKP